jgi:hypothetical protein
MSVGNACRMFVTEFLLILKESKVRGHTWNMATCIVQYVAYLEKYINKWLPMKPAYVQKLKKKPSSHYKQISEH